MTQVLSIVKTFEVYLRDPWDAAYLAKNHPEVFELKDDLMGIVEIIDLVEAYRLSGSIHIVDDERGFLLSVNGIEQPVTVTV